jgi:uncharacterized surface protein with fasciclin (FAS1) repeats
MEALVPRLREIYVLAAILAFGTSYPVLSQEAAKKEEERKSAPPKSVIVRTITDSGDNIRATIKVKIFPKDEAVAYVKVEGSGYKIVLLERCDDTVSLFAFADTLGIIRKQGDAVEDWLPCKEPEVVFNDFRITPFDTGLNKKALSDPVFWNNAFESGNSVVNAALSADIADAFAKKEYGKISIIGSELHQQFRAAGKQSEADFFYSMSVDAAAKGILESTGISKATDAAATEYLAATGRFELSLGAKTFVEKYQQEKLGISASSEDFGKIGWTTMKSLAGGDSARTALYQLPPDSIAEFNAGNFVKTAYAGKLVGGAEMFVDKNIIENQMNSKDYTTLVAAVSAAGLVDTLKGAGPFTVFAPVNAAFDALPAGTVDTLLKPENKAQLAKILNCHVVGAEAMSDAIMRMVADDGGAHKVKTIGGCDLTLRVAGGKVTVTDETGGVANVTISDVEQSNGVIHVIDKVLLPKG